MEEKQGRQPAKNTITISFDYKWLIIALLALGLVGMFFLWRPWEPRIDKNARSVEVGGAATVKAEPDQFIFTPSYEFKNANKQTALDAASEKNSSVNKKLKGLGVADHDVKSQTYGYGGYAYENRTTPYTYTLRYTITLTKKDLAQKVQDYLTTTSPEGSVTPSYSFSKSKQKSLEDEARQLAIRDAKKKAEQSAQNLGFSLGDVKSVNDGSFDNWFGIRGGIMEGQTNTDDSKAPAFTLQPGENELDYTVRASFYIR